MTTNSVSACRELRAKCMAGKLCALLGAAETIGYKLLLVPSFPWVSPWCDSILQEVVYKGTCKREDEIHRNENNH